MLTPPRDPIRISPSGDRQRPVISSFGRECRSDSECRKQTYFPEVTLTRYRPFRVPIQTSFAARR